MATTNPTTPTFGTAIAAEIVTTGNKGTRGTLDLRTSWGAWLYVRIGRIAATALTRSGYVMVRKQRNNAGTLLVHPSTALDRVSGIAASNVTTLTGALTANGSNATATITTTTGFTVGDTVCIWESGPTAVEFAKVLSGPTASVLTFEEPYLSNHANGANISRMADIFDPLWLSGGDQYEFYSQNNSGQSLLFEAYYAQYVSDTY